MKISKFLLILAGLLSFGIAVFQAAISFVPEWSAAFDAGDALVSNPPLLLSAGLLVSLVFTIFGLYALSGAGIIRRLPLLRLGLLWIGLVYTLRGIPFFFQFLMVLGILPSSQPVPLTALLSSLVSLVVGLVYLAGLITGWKVISAASNTGQEIHPPAGQAENGDDLSDADAADIITTWNLLNPP